MGACVHVPWRGSTVTRILTTLVLGKVLLRLSRFNYERITLYSFGHWSTSSNNNTRTIVALTVPILILIIYSGK